VPPILFSLVNEEERVWKESMRDGWMPPHSRARGRPYRPTSTQSWEFPKPCCFCLR